MHHSNSYITHMPASSWSYYLGCNSKPELLYPQIPPDYYFFFLLCRGGRGWIAVTQQLMFFKISECGRKPRGIIAI